MHRSVALRLFVFPEHSDMVLQAAPFECTSGMLTILSLSGNNLLDFAIASDCMQCHLQLISTRLSPCMDVVVCTVLLCTLRELKLGVCCVAG